MALVSIILGSLAGFCTFVAAWAFGDYSLAGAFGLYLVTGLLSSAVFFSIGCLTKTNQARTLPSGLAAGVSKQHNDTTRLAT